MNKEFQSTPSVGRATRPASERAAEAVIFQSTPSVGRATTAARIAHCRCQISIHALRGEGDLSALYGKMTERISIHALRGEGDEKYVEDFAAMRDRFQSTPSVGRATRVSERQCPIVQISIHALRGEGDEVE